MGMLFLLNFFTSLVLYLACLSPKKVEKLEKDIFSPSEYCERAKLGLNKGTFLTIRENLSIYDTK